MTPRATVGTSVGPFVLEQPLGAGAMGEVWRARHPLWPEPVALKLLRGAGDGAWQRWFETEVRAVARLDHPNVVRIHDVGVDEALGLPWLVMAMAAGTLRARRTPWERLRVALYQLLDGLAHAHARGVVHRDLKPGNVLVDRNGVHLLADFGIADLGREGMVAPPRSSTGTPLYMAPEQIEGRWRDHGPWTDLYALGCIAHELALGRHPLAGRPNADVLRAKLGEGMPPLRSYDLPPGLPEWVARLCARDPAERFERAADALAALEGLERAPRPERLPAVGGALLPGSGLALVGLRALRLVGRDAEQGRLRAVVDGIVEEGAGRVVILRGPAGVGKSRLARWLCQDVHERGVCSVMWATHDVNPGPHDGLAAMVVRDARCGGLDAPAAVARLARRTGRHDAVALSALVDPDGAEVRLDSAAERFGVIRRYLAHEARRRPIVVWLDDVQWGPETLAFLRWWKRQPPLPVLLLLTAREEALAEHPDRRALLDELADEVVEVGPLDDTGRAALVRQLLRLERGLAVRVEERCGGNPLFAVQLVGDWVERGVLVPTASGFQLAEGAEARLPDDLREVWGARLEAAVDARDASSLEIGAALGLVVDGDEWRRVCAAAGMEADEALVDALVRRGLARRERAGWAWVHGMLREVVAERSAARGTWRGWHAACADALAEAGAGRRARHLVEAGALEEAVAPLHQAAVELGQAGRLREGTALLQEREAILDALEAPVRDPRRVEGWTSMARFRTTLGEHDAAVELVERAVAEAEAGGWPELLASALCGRASCERMAGRRDASRASAQRALALFRAAGDRAGMARAHALVADVEPDARAAREHVELALEQIPVERRSRALRAALVMRLASTWVMCGELGRAEGLYRQAEAIYTALGNRYMLAQTEAVLGSILYRRGGDPVEARRYMERAHERMVALDNPRGIVLVLGALAGLDLLEGDLERAEARAREAVEGFHRLGLRHRVDPHLTLISVLVQTGREGEARALLERIERQLGTCDLETSLAVGITAMTVAHDEAELMARLDAVEAQLAGWHADAPEPLWVGALDRALARAGEAGWGSAGRIQRVLDALCGELGADDTFDL